MYFAAQCSRSRVRLIRLVVFIFLNFLFVNLFAQQNKAVFEKDITDGFVKGQASSISAYFSESVQLELGSNRGTYSRQQAAILLESFIGKLNPTGFSVSRSGTAALSEATFLIGELQSDLGKHTVYLLSSTESAKTVIHSLSITPL